MVMVWDCCLKKKIQSSAGGDDFGGVGGVDSSSICATVSAVTDCGTTSST